MQLTITTLTENTVSGGRLLAEHGLSMLLDTGDRRILLDTGQTVTALHNAQVLRLDIGRLDAIVVSHGHADHTGGLKAILMNSPNGVDVFGHPAIWTARYSVRRGQKPRYSGIPHLKDELETLGARFHLTSGASEIAPGVFITGEVPRRTRFESVDRALKVRQDGDWQQDELLDDQALVVRTEKGLVVLLGCAHSGIINTLERAREISGEERIYAVLGGTHLGPASSEQLEATVKALKAYGIKRLGVSHCTGMRPAVRLATEFGDAFFFNNVETVTELP